MTGFAADCGRALANAAYGPRLGGDGRQQGPGGKIIMDSPEFQRLRKDMGARIAAEPAVVQPATPPPTGRWRRFSMKVSTRKVVE